MHMKDRLKQIRIDNKMSQEQFGKEVDLTKGTVSKFESGKAFPSRETIENNQTFSSSSRLYLWKH